MNTIMRYLTGAVLAAAALGSALPQSATHELSLSDIKAQSPQETIFRSDPCRLARGDPANEPVFQRYDPNPKTFVPDLHTLMEISDEVVLVGVIEDDSVLSPSGKSVATYDQIRVIHSWKGPHHAGDVLVFGVPYGDLLCTPTIQSVVAPHFILGESLPATGPYLYVLFLRQAKGDETQLVQGLFPAAGEGTQGMFMIPLPELQEKRSGDYCIGISMQANGKRCDTLMQTNQSPVGVLPDTRKPPDPNPPDPLVKKYNGMPALDFLREVQSVAGGQGDAQKSSSR
jgi:hypothetical protein